MTKLFKKFENPEYECIGVKFVNTIKVLPDVTCYLTTFVQKSQKSLHIKLLTRSSLHIWKLYRVNNPKLTEILPQYIRNLSHEATELSRVIEIA